MHQEKGQSIEGERGSWLTTLRSSWQAVLQIDRSQVTAFQALRSTFGVILPLSLGVATRQISAGIVIASGGLMLGSVGLRDPYRTRVRAMLLVSLLVALSTFVGSVTGGIGWLLLLATGLWGVAAGMFSSFSQVAQVVGLQACVALIVYGHLAQRPVQALQTALLVLAGALFQMLLVIIPSPWKDTAPERSALAALYQKLADYARDLFRGPDTLRLADALLQAYTTLLHSDTRTEKGQMFARLLDEAERLRLTLTILAQSYQRLGEMQQEGEAGDYLSRIICASGDELRSIAQALQPSSGVSAASESVPETAMKQALAGLRSFARSSGSQEQMQAMLPYCTALLAELRIVRRLAMTWRSAGSSWPVHIRFPYARPPHLHLEDTWSGVRANLTLRSSAFRHALRLGIALMLATVLYQIFHLSPERGYWIPMTVVIVLRSDFLTTFTRGIARLLGTTLGAVLTTLLVVFLAPSQPVLVVIIALAVYLMFCVLFANYAIFSVAVSMAVVFLLSFIAPQTVTTAANRAMDTVIGGALALLIYAIWPTWEQSQVPANIALRLEKQGRYLNAVMQIYVSPAKQDLRALDERRIESRLARSNAIGSMRRALQEPQAHRVDGKLRGLLEAADNISRSALALEAYWRDHPGHDALPAAATFGEQADTALSQIAEALRAGRQPAALPDLSAARRALQTAVKARKPAQDEVLAQWQFVIAEVKHIAANIEAMQQLLAINV